MPAAQAIAAAESGTFEILIVAPFVRLLRRVQTCSPD